MVYICLDDDSKTRGKAAIDVVGAQFGKTIGSLAQQVLLLMSGGALFGITPVMLMVYILMQNWWQGAVDTLSCYQGQSRSSSVSLKAMEPHIDTGVSNSMTNREVDPNVPPSAAEPCL